MNRIQKERSRSLRSLEKTGKNSRRARGSGETRKSWRDLLVGAAIFVLASFTSPAKVEAKSSSPLAERIHRALVKLLHYRVFDNLTFRIENNDEVVLMGQVTQPSFKSAAENVVKRFEEVSSVDDQIEVLPASSNDNRIRLATYRAIYHSSALSRYAIRVIPPIHIIVKDGRVTLEGAVASESDSNIARILACGVSGVFSVTNHLVVDRA